MKKSFCLLIVFGLIWTITGCAIFTSAPRIARIQIKGPNNQVNEFSIPLDHRISNNSDLDIALSERYAIQLQLQWLWYDKEDFEVGLTEDGDIARLPLRPWVIGKYRF